MNATLAVIAKAPQPRRSKTRLCPPLSPEQAAVLAEAALCDTLAAVRATPARHVLALDGQPGAWLPRGIEVIAQRGYGLDERLANAFADINGPALIVGMDTPQLTPRMLRAALDRLADAPAVLGPASDGGYWTIGLRHPDARALRRIPMSTRRTLAAQRARLSALGIAAAELPTLRDVDTYADAQAVAASAPHSRFASALASIELGRAA